MMSHTSIHTRQPSDFNVTPGRRDSDDHLGHDIATAIFQDEWSENISLHTMQSHEAPTNAANGTSHDKDDPRTKPGAIKPKNNPTQLKLRWHGGWLTEIISLVAAWCIMVAVIAILYHYRGKQLSETPTRPSLNTIINILSTAFTALVTLATTAVLSQSKWARYHQSQPLNDLQKIDAATRGPRGALAVIFSPRLGMFVLSGAVIVMSATLVGPTLQETVTARVVTVPDLFRNATVPIAQVYVPPGVGIDPENDSMDLPMQGAVLDGILPSVGNNTSISFNCPTGNCTFQAAYTSVAVCHECAEQLVTRACITCGEQTKTGPCKFYEDATICNYTLPNGHYLAGNYSDDTEYSINVSTAYGNEDQYWGSLGIATMSIISLAYGPTCLSSDCNGTVPQSGTASYELIDPIGAVCSLFFCAKTYVADISENLAEERIIAITPSPANLQTSLVASSDIIPIVADPCYIEGEPFSLEKLTQLNRSGKLELLTLSTSNGTPVSVPEQCVYVVYSGSAQALSGWMVDNSNLFDGNGSEPFGTADHAYYSFSGNFGVQPLWNKGNASFQSLNTAFEGLATAMTNRMRQSGDPANATVATGILMQLQTKVFVQWYWLIVPIAYVFAGSIYLATAIVFENSNVETRDWKWKSNPLPLLGLHLKSKTGEPIDLLSSEGTMKRAATKITMRLVKVDDGWELVEEQSISSKSEEEGLRDAAA